MKRLGAIACLVVFMLSMTMSFAMAAGELKIDGICTAGTDVAVMTIGRVNDAMGLSGISYEAAKLACDKVLMKQCYEQNGVRTARYRQVYFNEDVYKSQKSNKKLCKIVDNKGKEVPSIVVVNPKDKNLMMVLADTNNKKTKIKGKTKYTLVIEKGFRSDKGSVLSEEYKSSFETLNPSTSMWISMGMMGVMVVGMVFFSTREAKKQKEKAEPDRREKSVNPYKEAKRTGKSVEEIVAAEEKRKAKNAAKRERQRAENKVEIASSNIKVKRKAPISAVGLKYKTPKPKQKTKEQALKEKQQAQGKKKNQNKKKKK